MQPVRRGAYALGKPPSNRGGATSRPRMQRGGRQGDGAASKGTKPSRQRLRRGKPVMTKPAQPRTDDERPNEVSRVKPGAAGTTEAMPADLDEAKLRQQALGARLRQMFEDVMNEPVPDDFLDILRSAEGRGGKPT